MPIDAELKRRDPDGNLIPWELNADGTDPVADAGARASLDGILTQLQEIFTELQTKLAAGEAVALDTATLAALESVTVAGTVEVTNPTADPETGLAKDLTLDQVLAELASKYEGDPVEVSNFPADQKVHDDYTAGEVLEDQAGADGVLTFTFATPVHLVVVESSGDGLVSRADPFGGIPDLDTGIAGRHEVPTFMPVMTSEVKVFAPAGTTVSVYGYRR